MLPHQRLLVGELSRDGCRRVVLLGACKFGRHHRRPRREPRPSALLVEPLCRYGCRVALTRDDLPDWVIEGDRLGAPGFRALPVEGWPKRQAGLLAHFGDDGRLTFLLAFKYKSAEAAIWLRPDSGYLDAGIWGEAYHANGTLEDFAAAFDNDDPPRFADETFANWERRRVAFVVNKGEPLHGLPDLPSFDQERPPSAGRSPPTAPGGGRRSRRDAERHRGRPR
jgi:hypothetical protein